MKTIWMINQYATTPATGIGGRHHYLARELAKEGYKVYVIAASWHHLLKDPDGAPRETGIEEVDGYKFVRLAMPRYRDAHDKKRFLNWLLFAWKVSRLHRLLPERPDAIIASSPALFMYLGARRQARRHKAKLAFEVRDFWPLSLIELGGKSPRHPLIRVMQRVEDHAYKTADVVLSNTPNAVKHMQSRGMDPDKFVWVSNGFSLEEVSSQDSAPADVLDKIPSGKFVIGYAGTIGLANSLDTLIDSAAQLKDHEDIHFALLGDGRAIPDLQRQCAALGLTNVSFLGRVNKTEVQSVINRFDACFLGWKHSPLYNFGIAANKIYDYLYAGKPVLHCYSGALDPFAAYQCGVSIPAEDSAALSEAILALQAQPQDARDRMGQRGRQAALEHHEYNVLARRLAQALTTGLGDWPPSPLEQHT